MNNKAQSGVLMPMVMAVVAVFALLFIGGFVVNTISEEIDR